ncbi:hypothetical protein GCM10028806_36600 [Spirosoma terrae]|uniref:Uncharacterized protein n=1 Tax=Spirosoma terrae TaxID=1968276 RepID=A0A6L9LE06_9BACT|nr:hypothetical protein [Spirosoma terrae]NDU97391.1 hypothetical protein [Spirosoma terrae]
MRPLLLSFVFSACASVCFGQADTSKIVREPARSPSAQVPIPGIDAPLSGPGTLMQSSPQPNAVATPQKVGKKGKVTTNPPSDPRAFGVAVPVGKAKKDTLR